MFVLTASNGNSRLVERRDFQSGMKSVILVTVDSLRADHLSCYGYPIRTSPNIDRLAQSGVRFVNAFSNGGGTPEAFPSILYGTSPPMHWNEYGHTVGGGLPEFFKGLGYKTAAFHSNAYVSRYFGYNRFFDTFEDSLPDVLPLDRQNTFIPRVLGIIERRLLSKLPPHIPLPLSDSIGGDRLISALTQYHGKVNATEITSRAISWLHDVKGEYFLWVHYMDVHSPYLPPVQYFPLREDKGLTARKLISTYLKTMKGYESLTSDEVETLIALYDCCVRYVDSEIGRLVDFVKQIEGSGAVVFFTADHGEAFGEHGSFNHQDVHEEVLHVPLIITGTGVDSRTAYEPVSSQDIPDFARAAASQGPVKFKQVPKDMISVSLDPFRGTRSVSYQSEEWKYIRVEKSNEKGEFICTRDELYNIRSDRAETRNLVSEFPELGRECEAKILVAIGSAPGKSSGSEPRTMSAQDEELVRKRLERLGYS